MLNELDVQIGITKAFINTRPVTLVLIPHAAASDGTGGKRLDPFPDRPPQVCRFVESGSNRADIRRTETGEQWTQDAVLLMMPDAMVAINDTFEWDGSTWKVDELQFPNEYEVRAVVLRHGR